MLRSKDIFIYFFNFFGVTSVRKNSENCLKTSKFLLLFNFFKLFLSFGYKLLFLFYLEKLFKIKSFYDLEEKTNFASIITFFEEILYQSLCVSSFVTQNLNFKSVRKCLIYLKELDLNDYYKLKYLKTYRVFTVVSVSYFITTNGFYFYFLSTAQYPAQILLLISIFNQGYLLLLYCFLKMIEAKLISQMKQLNYSLNYNFSKSGIELISQKICRILNGFQLFKETCSIQFSLNVGFFACSITFGVNYIKLIL